jgi:hypothetical protein
MNPIDPVLSFGCRRLPPANDPSFTDSLVKRTSRPGVVAIV